MNDQQLLRYSRHILLDDIDIEGQERILAGHALIIGGGGLGSPAALYLASAGLGKITLVDDDTVDLTNLQRQIMHTTQRVGMLKVESGRAAITQINPDVDVVTVAQRVSEEQLAALVQDATVVLDCSDNFATRHAVNRACVRHRVPLVSGAAIRFDGQISVFDTRRDDAPCYACLFPPDQQFEEIQCSTMGIIGTMQAAEALKLVAEVGEPLIGRLQILDARRMEWTTIQFQRNHACPVCGGTHQ